MDNIKKSHKITTKNSATFEVKVAELRCINDRLMI